MVVRFDGFVKFVEVEIFYEGVIVDWSVVVFNIEFLFVCEIEVVKMGVILDFVVLIVRFFIFFGMVYKFW